MCVDDDVDNITFNSIVVVESLGRTELPTGQMLCESIVGLASEVSDIRPTYVSIGSCAQFAEVLHSLVDQAHRRGARPILHIEAHGDEHSGIHFADDTNLDWNTLCDLITPLNEATDLGLTVVVAACYGLSLIDGIRLSKPAPCSAFIGPSDTITEPEVLGVFRDFYSALLRTLDAARAVRALRDHTLCEGSLNVMTSRAWFELLMTKYLREEASRTAAREYALKHYLQAKHAGGSTSMRELKRQFRRDLPMVVRKYFETFFMIDDKISAARYRSLWHRIERELQML